MVVSGAPDKMPHHAVKIADLAFDMIDAMYEIPDPSTSDEWSHVRIRIGQCM